MSFPRYPRYKDSGVEWLGEVPEHWDVKRLRFVADLNPSKIEVAHVDRATTVTFLPMEAIGEDGQIDREREKTVAEVETGYTYFRDGDVVLAKITPCFENGKGARITDLKNGIGFGTTELIVARPREGLVDGRFLHLLFQSRIFRDLGEARMYGAGGQKRVPDSFVRDFVTALPPLSEQYAVVEFLGRETAKIDGLVAEQQRLIELLKEKRQAVISHAVTRGLDPDAPMKPSGVEWLGNVPAHWDLHRIGNLFEEVDQRGTDELPVLSVSIHNGVSDREFDEDELERTVSRSKDRSKYKQVSPNDLVYNMMRAWQGGFGTVTVPGMVSPAYVVARPKTRIVTRYVEHLLRTPQAIEQMRRYSRGVTDFRLRLYWDEFKNIRICLPPHDEANVVCESIQAMDAEFLDLVGEAERAIALLRERRTALISAAVMGKIDVRGLAQPQAEAA